MYFFSRSPSVAYPPPWNVSGLSAVMSKDGKSLHCSKSEEAEKHELDIGPNIHDLRRTGADQEKARTHGDPSPNSSKSSSVHHNEKAIEGDLEVAPTNQSNSPPYSVFSRRKKHFIVFLAAWGGFFSPLSANIYFPALTTLARDFHVSSTLMNLTLTSYMIFQGLAPTIFGDLADMA